MLVSVIIPTCNRARQLPAAIESVLSLAPADFTIEVIVVDDGSRDNTAEVVERYPVRYVRGIGSGAAVARNMGIRAARGELLAFLDNDGIYTRDNLMPQIAFLRANPEYAAAFGSVMLADSELNPTSGPFPSQPLPPEHMFESLLGFFPSLSSIVVRSEAAHTIGGFDTNLRGAEDWDFFLRLARSFPVAHLDHIAAYARQEESIQHFPERELRRRYTGCMAVWMRHTRALGMATRVRLLRQEYRLRGWYTSCFVRTAFAYKAHGDLSGMMRSLVYSSSASALHTCKEFLRQRPGRTLSRRARYSPSRS